MLKWSSRCTSGSKISSSMRSDCASVPTRGSRFVGLLSIIITSVLGSACLPQEMQESNNKAFNHKGHKVPRSVLFPLRVPSCPLWLNMLSIGNLSQDCRPLGPSRRRNIRRLAAPSLVSEQSKGHGLFGLAGNAKIIRNRDLESYRGCFVGKHLHQSVVLRATAGDDVIA